MAKKMYRKDLRLDEVTHQLLAALVEQNTTDKKAKEAAIMRSAIYRMAQQDLSPEAFADIVKSSLDMEKVVYDL